VAVARVARVFKQLEVSMPRQDLARRYENYCRSTPLRFYSVEHFADTLPAWDRANGGGAQDALAQRPGESLDAYAARLATQ
jgi:hypothetical protein